MHLSSVSLSVCLCHYAIKLFEALLKGFSVSQKSAKSLQRTPEELPKEPPKNPKDNRFRSQSTSYACFLQGYPMENGYF